MKTKMIFLAAIFSLNFFSPLLWRGVGGEALAQSDGSDCTIPILLPAPAQTCMQKDFRIVGNLMWFEFTANSTNVWIAIYPSDKQPSANIKRIVLFDGECSNLFPKQEVMDNMPALEMSNLVVGKKYKIMTEREAIEIPGNYKMCLQRDLRPPLPPKPPAPPAGTCNSFEWTEVGSTGNIYNCDGGNVGINNDNPSKRLHIKNKIGGDGIWIDHGSSVVTRVRLSSTASGFTAGTVGTESNHDFHIVTNNTTRIKVSNNGNVGIGFATSASPAYTLDVNGTIRACEARVNMTGCDFVFEPDYQLMSLPALADFIKVNKHLPEIPTAKEMEENGSEVGTMQSKLLQKIEELTLHTIAINKQVENLKNENEEMKKEIEHLKKK